MNIWFAKFSVQTDLKYTQYMLFYLLVNNWRFTEIPPEVFWINHATFDTKWWIWICSISRFLRLFSLFRKWMKVQNSLINDGFPIDWQQIYIERQFRKHDSFVYVSSQATEILPVSNQFEKWSQTNSTKNWTVFILWKIVQFQSLIFKQKLFWHRFLAFLVESLF